MKIKGAEKRLPAARWMRHRRNLHNAPRACAIQTPRYALLQKTKIQIQKIEITPPNDQKLVPS
jgi:hypothetical protein